MEYGSEITGQKFISDHLRKYMKTIITTMMLHINEIEFEKDAKGTITGYKSHKISSEILDKLMPWNMA